MSETETRELKKLLVDYYSEQLEDEIDKVVIKKGYSQKDFDDILNSESYIKGYFDPDDKQITLYSQLSL